MKANYNSTLDSEDFSSWDSIMKSYMGVDYVENNSALSVIDFMVFNRSNNNTLVNMVTNARENARSVQEHISREIWLSINKYFLDITNQDFYRSFKEKDPIDFIDELIQYHHIYYSVADVTQERGNAYCFMNVGKYLERILQSIDFLNVKVDSLKTMNNNLTESYFWKNLLVSIGGYQLYIKTYKSIFSIDNIIEMISLNEFFPRSIKFSVDKLYTHIMRLEKFNKPQENSLYFMTGKLRNQLKYSNLDSIKKQGLKKFAYEIQLQLNDISKEINKIYFYQINS
tara:strand:+ start:2083 stop:2934 length:852 start_codon:yes stop_codon:yes gene_type:complete